MDDPRAGRVGFRRRRWCEPGRETDVRDTGDGADRSGCAQRDAVEPRAEHAADGVARLAGADALVLRARRGRAQTETVRRNPPADGPGALRGIRPRPGVHAGQVHPSCRRQRCAGAAAVGDGSAAWRGSGWGLPRTTVRISVGSPECRRRPRRAIHRAGSA